MNANKVDDNVLERENEGRTWGERNGPTIFGISVFVSLFLVGTLMWLAN